MRLVLRREEQEGGIPKSLQGSPSPVIPEAFVQRAEEIIHSFDDRLRTAEGHGAGVLRKSTFTWIDLHDSPPMTLFGYWNYFNEVAHLVGAVFDSEVAQARADEPGARDAA